MRIGPTQRLGPELVTTWGTYPSPYFTAPEKNTRVIEYVADAIQGRHQFRTQPRNMSLLPYDPRDVGPRDTALQQRASLVDSDTVAHGVGEFPQETKVGLFIFLGLLGVAALLAGKGR